MERLLDMFDCNQTNANTGMQNCPFNPKEISGFIAMPKGEKITPAMQLALMTTLMDGLNNDNPIKRYYPVQDIWQLEEKSTESQTETSSFGTINYLADGKPAFNLQHKQGLTMHKLYRKAFHLQQNRYDILFIDKKNQALIGWKDADGNMYGFDLEMLSVESWKVPTGTNGTAMYSISLGLSSSEQWNDKISAIKLPTNLQSEQIVGLQQVELNNLDDEFTTGVAIIQVLGSTTNLYDTYSTDIADPSIWKAYNVDGDLINITGTVANDVKKGVEITLNTTSANYPTAGGTIVIKFGNVTALIANNMPRLSEATLITKRD